MKKPIAFLGLVVSLSAGHVVANSGDDGEITACQVPDGTLLPDLLTVVPKHLQLHNKQQREIIRFTNGIANLGQGLWWVEPVFPTDDLAEDQIQSANQVFFRR